jgi:hypothetical protein
MFSLHLTTSSRAEQLWGTETGVKTKKPPTAAAPLDTPLLHLLIWHFWQDSGKDKMEQMRA